MDARLETASELMRGFAERTGLTGARAGRRYLWTDAFAVCNFLGLARGTGDARYSELALALVDRVHHTLGRHRPDDRRTGWISGLDEHAGEVHPTRGGLRIGKPLPERAQGERLDEALEWERDGQYFHYLTKWMHALDLVARSTHDLEFHTWARELAEAAHRAFVTTSALGDLRMYWKMSIDLSRPLVLSMGQHDPLDGFITVAQLLATESDPPAAGARLTRIANNFGSMVRKTELATDDSLGLGGLLVDAARAAQVPAAAGMLDAVLAAALVGLRHYLERFELRAAADQRLAFRELGLSIGLAALDRIPAQRLSARGAGMLDELRRYANLRTQIETCWLVPEHRRSAAWLEHEDINDVMLATSLAPDGFLLLPSPAR